MEPIQIHVSVELNLSQDVKNFLASVVSNNVTVPTAPAAPAAPQVTIEQVRKALAAKVNGHREEIKEKLNSLGAPSVTKLDPAKYDEMFTFLNALS